MTTTPPNPERGRPRLGALGVALATLVAMVATEPHLAIVWDEGYTLGREARVRAWLHALADPPAFAARWRPPKFEMVQVEPGFASPPAPREIDSYGELLTDRFVLAWFWPFAREEPHGHPPFYAIVGLLGDAVVPWWETLPRARFGPMLAFSLVAGVLYGYFSRRRGPWAGAAAAGAWALQPRLFAHGHYAHYDALLAGLWVAALLAFANAVERPGSSRRPRWGWALVFGLLAGCAAATKITGWLLPLPILAWTVVSPDRHQSRRGGLTLLVGGVVAAFWIYAITPPWWTAPLEGLLRFWHSNLTRGETIPIKIGFLGTIYETPTESLPWYNTLAWTVMVTPVGFLLLALGGVVRAIRDRGTDPVGLLALIHWAFFLILRALPHMPGHDGVRLFLPAFGILAILAGLGATSAPRGLGRWGKGLIAAALAEGAISVAVMMPVPLSYYSPAVGGLPGAAALGMEPTYYWDSLTGEAIDWLNARTPEGDRVMFSTVPTAFVYLHGHGRLEPWFLDPDPRFPDERTGPWRWYVFQNRSGNLRPVDRALIAGARPAFVVRNLGVPLLYVFDIRDAVRLDPLRRRRERAD